ncbi:hypothetical protein SXCC_02051 [Gluconacetobacter sp. SXCC-1]|nr:hypothetical protein SXCC_02051 [Gluconacetobacter sp. SXCC-1]
MVRALPIDNDGEGNIMKASANRRYQQPGNTVGKPVHGRGDCPADGAFT